jgi:hypothetical protein
MRYIECKPDETLVRALGCPRREFKHTSGKSRVCGRLEKDTGAVGIVDEDPGSVQPSYLVQAKALATEHDICVREDQKRENKIVVLKPRLEEWLIKTAAGAGLSMEEFGLSSKPDELHREINSRIPALQKLIGRLCELKEKRILHLRKQAGL